MVLYKTKAVKENPAPMVPVLALTELRWARIILRSVNRRFARSALGNSGIHRV
jgi:hypothetical protein